MVVSAHENVTKMLQDNMDVLKAMTTALLEKETIMREDIEKLVQQRAA